MQTSCGSPCYAAPELVISEGLYVGSAVDICSCSIILYTMLAGYLPFDDDPANPDRDNINLLYKYTVNTPLSFPDYVSPEARDRLSMMLVPDPRAMRTCGLSWLTRGLQGMRITFQRRGGSGEGCDGAASDEAACVSDTDAAGCCCCKPAAARAGHTHAERTCGQHVGCFNRCFWHWCCCS